MSEIKTIRKLPVFEGAEISWFAPLCDGDDDFLGHRNPAFKSNWENTSDIVTTADSLGFRNILCPSSYQVGQDTLTFASAMAPLTHQINLLTAIRCGEVYPPMLARALATLDHILKGRLTINIISSDLPGTELSSSQRYARSREVITLLKQAWTQEEIDFQGEFYQIKLSAAPVKPYQQNGGPLLYFGGYSPDGVALCAEHCDVYLMWPETEDKLQSLMNTMTNQAAGFGRTVLFGLRVHVIVRETEEEAKAYAQYLISELDLNQGDEIRNRAQDAKSLGVSRQSELRDSADEDYFVEPNLWTGIGLARSGCGAAIVGNPDQVYDKIQRYIKMGIRSFIFSGYPHKQEADYFAKLVLPRLKTVSLPEVMGRIPKEAPNTPLEKGPRN
ncbi:LLM class flavin-dependent oxidoreductase [Flavobacteriaceae bacterium]|nr:LLM class flavin-dependent oxidoreductase [Flavobacteriaceae bacterium]MDB4151974.1 LLM class flavin-dependent oxidoreductase [Flavobacteriaceae bacterium]|tara:strand:- start:2587 stop:3747 length:1161 start_codon:yes stop_codon:yes gene_type:complete